MTRQGTESVLNKYRALDLTDEKGFLCGKILGDLGVDVIKVERPGGDPGRNLGPFYHDESDPEKSLLWWAFNTSKRGITLDIEGIDGQETFKKLVRSADFVIESFPPGYMAKLGLGYEELSKVNPGIIMVSISGFGQDGPYARYKAPDIVCTAMSGYMNLMGDSDRSPVRITIPQAYLHASNDAAAGCLIALWHREMTGEGQWVDVSAQECMAWLGFNNYIYWEFQRINRKRGGPFGRMQEDRVPLSIYPCKDGYVLFTAFSAPITVRTRAMVEWMEEEGMANDLLSGFDWGSHEQNTTLSEEEWQLMLEIFHSFEPFILTKTKKELFEQAISRGFLLAPINSVQDVFQDAHFQARRFWQTVEHPELEDKIIYPGAPYISVDSPYRIRNRAPLIGEHNEEVLRSELRPSKDQIDTPEVVRDISAEALKGLKVIEFTWYTVGPRTVRYLADHGATVVKVESPVRFDGGRANPPYKGEIAAMNQSGWFSLFNANKYGMTLDLNKPEGVAIAKRLIKWADVLVESYRPDVMKKWGLDYESVKDLNPGLIYASTCMFGQTGPYRRYVGFGHHAAAIGGFDDITGWPDRMPNGVFWAYTDHVAPQFLASAIMTALFQRRKTGKGQYIDQSQNESAVQFLAPAFLEYAVNGRVAARNGNHDPYAAPHNAYRCVGEDRWCVIAIYTDEEWQSFCGAIGQPRLIKDKKFDTLMHRKENEVELDQLVEKWTSRLSAETVMSRLQQAGVAAGVVETAEDMHHDPQFKYRDHFLTFDHSVMGPHSIDALPFRLLKTPAKKYLPDPCLGEHNTYVCTDILGMSDEEFVRLFQAGVFGY